MGLALPPPLAAVVGQMLGLEEGLCRLLTPAPRLRRIHQTGGKPVSSFLNKVLLSPPHASEGQAPSRAPEHTGCVVGVRWPHAEVGLAFPKSELQDGPCGLEPLCPALSVGGVWETPWLTTQGHLREHFSFAVNSWG